MEKQIERIKEKLAQLKNADTKLSLFGANTHEYTLNDVLSENDIKAFESKYGIKLPEEFAMFLTKVGNGGAGPFYGLEPLQDTIYSDLDYKNEENILDPSKPFPHTEYWNMEFEPTVDEDDDEAYDEEFEAFAEEYYSKDLISGALSICNYGCGLIIMLVVNGEEYGYLWVDDRGNDGGIAPSEELGNKDKIKFLDWYELWLDKSHKEIKSK